MIKITIKDASDREDDYIKEVLDPLLKRIEYLKLSLEHLLGRSRIIKNNGIRSYQIITKNIILLIEAKKRHGYKKSFHETNYLDTIDKYRRNRNKLKQFKIKELLEYLGELEKNGGEKLKEMLICPAGDLYDFNESLRFRFNESEIKILSFAISYGFAELSGAVKTFFRTHNFVHSCPYCNKENAKYKQGKNGTAEGHVLDHYFCQAKFPMLALCMYNLVPCGKECNGPDNKGEIRFTKEFHLNPYVDGFGDRMFFSPIKKGKEVTAIKVNFHPNYGPGTDHYKQIFGDCADPSKKRFEKGNINVFKLEEKYSDQIAKAQKVLNTIDKRVNGLKSLHIYYDVMQDNYDEQMYKDWYYEELETRFDSEDFRLEDKSKFIRDIHDSYIRECCEKEADFIKKMIVY